MNINIQDLINRSLVNPDLIPLIHLISHYQSIKTDQSFNQIIIEQLLAITNQSQIPTPKKFDQDTDQIIKIVDQDANQILYFYYNHHHQSYYHFLFDNLHVLLNNINQEIDQNLEAIINNLIKIIKKQPIQLDWFTLIDCNEISDLSQFSYWQSKVKIKLGSAWFNQTQLMWPQEFESNPSELKKIFVNKKSINHYQFNPEWIRSNQIFCDENEIDLTNLEVYLPLFMARSITDDYFINQWEKNVSWDWTNGYWKMTNQFWQMLKPDYIKRYTLFEKQWFKDQPCSLAIWNHFQSLDLVDDLIHLKTIFKKQQMYFTTSELKEIVAVSFNDFCFPIKLVKAWSNWTKQHQLITIDESEKQLVFQINNTNVKLVFTNVFLIKADFFNQESNYGFNYLLTNDKMQLLWSNHQLDLKIKIAANWLWIADIYETFNDFFQFKDLIVSGDFSCSDRYIWLTFTLKDHQLTIVYYQQHLSYKEQKVLSYYFKWWQNEIVKQTKIGLDLPQSLTLSQVDKSEDLKKADSYFWKSNYEWFPFSQLVKLIKQNHKFTNRQSIKRLVNRFYKRLYF